MTVHTSVPVHADDDSTGPQPDPAGATSGFPCPAGKEDRDDENLLAYMIIVTTFSMSYTDQLHSW